MFQNFLFSNSYFFLQIIGNTIKIVYEEVESFECNPAWGDILFLPGFGIILWVFQSFCHHDGSALPICVDCSEGNGGLESRQEDSLTQRAILNHVANFSSSCSSVPVWSPGVQWMTLASSFLMLLMVMIDNILKIQHGTITPQKGPQPASQKFRHINQQHWCHGAPFNYHICYWIFVGRRCCSRFQNYVPDHPEYKEIQTDANKGRMRVGENEMKEYNILVRLFGRLFGLMSTLVSCGR